MVNLIYMRRSGTELSSNAEIDNYVRIFLNGCIRNTTAACGNIAIWLLLHPRWPVHFFELSRTI